MILRLLAKALVCVLCASTAYSLPAHAQTAADITDVILVTGQSNVRGSLTSYDSLIDTTNPQVFAFTKQNQWEVADLHQAWDVNGWEPGNGSLNPSCLSDPNCVPSQPYNNFAFHFAKTVAEIDPNRVVGIIVASAPGEGIKHWDLDGDFFPEIQNKVTLALAQLNHKTRLDGILWHQGETDWLDSGTSDIDATDEEAVDPDYYQKKLQSLRLQFASQSWYDSNTPFICGETKAAPVNSVLLELNNDQLENTACVLATDLTTRDANTHFDAAGLRTLGQRYGSRYQNITMTSEISLISPGSSTPLDGPSDTISWSQNIEAWLYAGSSIGGRQYFDSGNLGTISSVVATHLPTDGSDVHVRLWYRQQPGFGQWLFIDKVFQSSTNGESSSPIISKPESQTTLDSNSMLVEWNNATDAWLYIGSTLGGSQYHNSGYIGENTSALITDLPENGSEIHIRLWYRLTAGQGPWQYIDQTVTANTNLLSTPVMVSPAPSATLPAGTVELVWSAPFETWIYVGSTEGANDYTDTGNLGEVSESTLTNLPVDGSTVYVRIWYRSTTGTGSWSHVDYTYIAHSEN